MTALRLRFASNARPDFPLRIGMHHIGRVEDGDAGLGRVEDAAASMVCFCVDRRGVWLTVSQDERGVHVNGRRVQRLAMLRVGDAVYVDGEELRLVGERQAHASPPGHARAADDAGPDPRVVLRGIGGRHHGRSFTLDVPRLVGRAREADIRIDDPAFAERHARVELDGGQVRLRDLGSGEGSVVNGETVADALLMPGDQVVFDAHHRFVVEAPMRERMPGALPLGGFADDDEAGDEADETVAVPASGGEARRPWRLPWLLLAALALAGLLSLLLLYGAG